MRILRVALALLVVAAGVLIGAPPAFAGNWVVTVLDPVPDRFEPERSYTIGFWALQHGSHPYKGTFEEIGLKLVDAKSGAPLMFPATALPEPAHYTTSLVVMSAGTWNVYGVHEPFGDYRIGTLTVPGGLSVLPVPQPMPVDGASPWGEVRPPTVPIDPNRGPFDEDPAAVVVPPPAGAKQEPAAAAGTTPSAGTRPATTVLAVLAATALVLGLFLVQRRRRPATATAAPTNDRLGMQVGEAAREETTTRS